MVNPIVSRVGGKYYSYKKIIPHFPNDYKVYVEPFVGGGSIYFNTKPCETEVINDLDPQLTFIYRVNQDHIISFPVGHVSEEKFNEIVESNPIDSLGIITKYLLEKRLRLFGRGRYGLRTSISKAKNTNFNKIHTRLQNTIIKNIDYIDIINEYDSVDTFFYLDPPYENSAYTTGGKKKSGLGYDDIDLSKLAERLATLKGRFVMSLNDSDRTRELFKSFTIDTYTTIYHGTINKKTVTELLIKNF
jgi:DNA adenine methylase